MTKIYEYKDSVLGIINKKRRRMFAYIRQNQIRRIKAIIFIIMIVLSGKSVFAIENNNIKYGNYKIDSITDPYMYIKYENVMQPNYMYSYTLNGEKIPVYCLERGASGPEDTVGYITHAKEKITDEKLQMIILNSYPYKSATDLKLMSTEQAIFASQFAIWCYTSGIDIEKIEPISNLNLDVVEAIKRIYNSKDNNIEDYSIDLNIKESKMSIENIDGIPVVTKNISADTKNIIDYTIMSSDKNVGIKKEDNGYKVYIPLEKIQNKYSVNLSIEYIAKENVVLYGKKDLHYQQDMALTLTTQFNGKTDYLTNFCVKTTEITIEKEDRDTNEKLSGVKYSISDSNNTINSTFETNEEGIIKAQVKYIDNVTLNVLEEKAKDGYVIDKEAYKYELNNQNSLNLKMYNEKEKGKIKIIKKTKEYNETTLIPENTPLENVEFNILDSSYNIVKTIKTNKYGECETERLPIGKYYIKEVKTQEGYKLLNELVEVNIENNEDEILVQILNENAIVVKELPVTGK